MYRKSLCVFLLVAFTAFSSVSYADITVDQFRPVFQFKFGSFRYIYYRVDVSNTGAKLSRVIAHVSSDDPEARVFSSHVVFSKINALSSKKSFNGFFLRVPRQTRPDAEFLASALEVNFRFRLKLALSGQVIDDPIPNAAVTANVGGASSSATADPTGNYVVDVIATSFDDLVAVNAMGAGGQENVSLNSIVSSVLTLHNETGANGGLPALSAAEVSALDVTHITTAKAALLEESNGGPISSASELMEAELALQGNLLVRIAAAIKAVIDDPTVNLPAGVSDTAALAGDPAAYGPFIADLEANNPAAWTAALTATIAAGPGGQFAAATVPGVYYSTLLQNLNLVVGDRFEFNADGTATRTQPAGQVDATWSVDVDGALVLNTLAPFVQREFFSSNCPEQAGAVITQSLYFGSIFRLVDDGLAADQVAEQSLTGIAFPNNPECTTSAPTLSDAAAAIPLPWVVESNTGDFVATDFAGRQFAMPIWSNDVIGAPLSIAFPERGVDVLSFDVSGTGTTDITARSFLWSIDGDGHLEVLFATGEFNEYVLIGNDGDTINTVQVATTANGTFAFRGLLKERNPGLAFNNSLLVGPSFFSGWDESITLFPVGQIDEFTFSADNTGTLDIGSVNPTTWNISLADSRVVIVADFGFIVWERTWRLIDIVDDRYWVIETTQLGNPVDFVDTIDRVGFQNSYRVVP